MSIESVMPSSHLILCRPLFLLPPIPPSSRVFSNESTLRMRWPKYWSFSFSIIPSKEIPELISFRMDWLGLLESFKELLEKKKREPPGGFLLCPSFPFPKLKTNRKFYRLPICIDSVSTPTHPGDLVWKKMN